MHCCCPFALKFFFCPLAFSNILLCGAREGHRPRVLNYPCSTLALKPLKQCGWTDFMSAMMVWRGVILFRWSPLVHLLHLHPSFLSSLNISSLRSDAHACRYSNISVCVYMHTYPAYAQHSADYIWMFSAVPGQLCEVIIGQRSKFPSVSYSIGTLVFSDVSAPSLSLQWNW